MGIRSRSVQSAALWAVAIPAGIYMMAFGVAVLLGPPTRIGQGFWRPEKVFYGLLPVIAVPLVLTVTFRRWVGLFARARTARLVFCAVVFISIALDTTLFLRIRRRQDEKIHLDWQKGLVVFSWRIGQVKMPAGFTYQRELGIDTFVGRFNSKDRNLVVEYDIGELAAEHGGMGNLQTLTEGSRVRFGSSTYSDPTGAKKYFFKVSFPDAGCANFSLESTNEKDGAVIEAIASSFRPRGGVPAFVRRLLPEILRSDCRYRVEWPKSFLNGVDWLADSVDHLMGQR